VDVNVLIVYSFVVKQLLSLYQLVFNLLASGMNARWHHPVNNAVCPFRSDFRKAVLSAQSVQTESFFSPSQHLVPYAIASSWISGREQGALILISQFSSANI
jgi:hypothetical protein